MIRTAMFAAVVVCAGSLAHAQHITHSAPWLGKPLNLAVDGLPPGAPSWLFASTTGADVPTPFGTLGIDLASAFSLFAGDADAHGRVSVVVPVPEKIGLAELPLHVQAFYVDPSAPAGGALVPVKRLRLLGSRVYVLTHQQVPYPPTVRMEVYSSPSFEPVFTTIVPTQGLTDIARIAVSADGAVGVYNTAVGVFFFDHFFGEWIQPVSFANSGMWVSPESQTVYLRKSSGGQNTVWSSPLALPPTLPALVTHLPQTFLLGLHPGGTAAWFRLSENPPVDQLVDIETGDVLETAAWLTGSMTWTTTAVHSVGDRAVSIRTAPLVFPLSGKLFGLEFAQPGSATILGPQLSSGDGITVQRFEGTSRLLLQVWWFASPVSYYDPRILDVETGTLTTIPTLLPYRLLGPVTGGTNLAYVDAHDGRLYRIHPVTGSIQPLGGPDLPWARRAVYLRDFNGERVAFVGCTSGSCTPTGPRPIALVDPATLSVIERTSVHTTANIVAVSIPDGP